MKKRNKLLAFNSIITMMMQIVTMVCGLILPRLVLSNFGSNVNGLVASVTQFLSFIALLDGGLGGVVRAAYYKPLADNDENRISSVYNTSSKFYKSISKYFIIYICVLIVLFPVFSKDEFDFIYTATLIIIISLMTFFQYMWGYPLKVLVVSDQKAYLHNITQIITTILNTIVSVILIKFNASIHLIKLSASLIYIIQPLFLSLYVKKHYRIDRKIPIDENTVKQRWSALARHIAFYIHSNTDIAILTILTDFTIVSIYSVYKLVVNGLTNLVAGIIGNTEATFGNILASNDETNFNTEFKKIDFITKSISTICYTTCIIMICKFVTIYTRGVEDTNYYRPIFAILICLSEWIYCMGLNFNNVIISVGHFKQTQNIAIIEAAINVFLSLILVFFVGLEGVVLATCIAMLYKLIANVVYMQKNIVKIDISYICKSFAASIVTIVISIGILYKYVPNVDSYIMFFVEAGCVCFIVTLINMICNVILCKSEFVTITSHFINGRKNKVYEK